jgi:hypothetical protein
LLGIGLEEIDPTLAAHDLMTTALIHRAGSAAGRAVTEQSKGP